MNTVHVLNLNVTLLSYRDAEERYETCQREVVQSARKLKELQQEVDELRNEVKEERKVRKG